MLMELERVHVEVCRRKAQIEKITREISGYDHLCSSVITSLSLEENLSLRRITEYQTYLHTLQKEKSDCLNKFLEYVNEVLSLCGVLVLDFGQTVIDVHPSLFGTGMGHSTNISNSGKVIMDRIDRWLSACEEEKWLEEYSQDDNWYNAERCAHINLKRAEQARIIMSKIAAVVDNLINISLAWEEEKQTLFLYNGVQLVFTLNDNKLARLLREKEKRYRDQKKLQDLLLTENEAIYGSKPCTRKSNSFRMPNSYRADGNESMTPTAYRNSIGSRTPESLTLPSYSSHENVQFNEMKSCQLHHVTSVRVSEPPSPP